MAYTEQEGSKRQRWPSIGLTVYRYIWMRRIRILCIA